MSTMIRTCGRGGKIHSFCAMYSLRISACSVPPSAARGMPLFSAATHIERDRKSHLALREQEVIAFVGLARVAEAGELAHRPEPVAVHVRVDAARVGIHAGQRFRGTVDRSERHV
jgi:hypothetical protein